MNRISAIVNGKRAITVDTAMRLARYFGTSPQYWLNLQVAYDLEVAGRRFSRRSKRKYCHGSPPRSSLVPLVQPQTRSADHRRAAAFVRPDLHREGAVRAAYRAQSSWTRRSCDDVIASDADYAPDETMELAAAR
jgi:transcriptional regulator with XRE-family HTH domain